MTRDNADMRNILVYERRGGFTRKNLTNDPFFSTSRRYSTLKSIELHQRASVSDQHSTCFFKKKGKKKKIKKK